MPVNLTKEQKQQKNAELQQYIEKIAAITGVPCQLGTDEFCLEDPAIVIQFHDIPSAKQTLVFDLIDIIRPPKSNNWHPFCLAIRDVDVDKLNALYQEHLSLAKPKTVNAVQFDQTYLAGLSTNDKDSFVFLANLANAGNYEIAYLLAKTLLNGDDGKAAFLLPTSPETAKLPNVKPNPNTNDFTRPLCLQGLSFSPNKEMALAFLQKAIIEGGDSLDARAGIEDLSSILDKEKFSPVKCQSIFAELAKHNPYVKYLIAEAYMGYVDNKNENTKYQAELRTKLLGGPILAKAHQYLMELTSASSLTVPISIKAKATTQLAEVSAMIKKMFSPEEQKARKELQDALTSYIDRIAKSKTNDPKKIIAKADPSKKINFSQGFTFFTKSQATNRAVNLLFAKQLRARLDGPESIETIFSNIKKQRNQIIDDHKLGSKSMISNGIFSDTQNQIIKEGKGFNPPTSKPPQRK